MVIRLHARIPVRMMDMVIEKGYRFIFFHEIIRFFTIELYRENHLLYLYFGATKKNVRNVISICASFVVQ